jgi:phosphoserine phosphatase RsbU/P
MKRSEQAALLAQIPLFTTLSQFELEHLGSTLQPREFKAGSLLLFEGETDEHFYILMDGEVEVVKALGTPDERRLSVKSGGNLFGEMGLFDREGRHTASVRALTDLHMLEMTRPDFDALLHRHPSLAYEMVRLMSRRLEESENITIHDLHEKNRQLSQAYEELKEAQAQLIIKEQLEKELSIARQIQMSILPERLPYLPGFDVAALTIPARAVGGDYYDFISLKGERFGLVVGDACDKGIPAALMISLTNSLVHVEAPRNATPEKTLRLVNRYLLEMSRSGMFVTLLYGILDSNGRLDYCRAGHPHPLILDGSQRPIVIGSASGMPLGLMQKINLDARSVTIPPGGVAIVYSDGLSEAKDVSGSEYGAGRLAEELPSLSHLPSEQICVGLWKRIQEFCGNQPQHDDFTVVVIKREI